MPCRKLFSLSRYSAPSFPNVSTIFISGYCFKRESVICSGSFSPVRASPSISLSNSHVTPWRFHCFNSSPIGEGFRAICIPFLAAFRRIYSTRLISFCKTKISFPEKAPSTWSIYNSVIWRFAPPYRIMLFCPVVDSTWIIALPV